MTLTIGLPVTHDYFVTCDHPSCGAAYQRDSGSVDEVVARVVAIGWTVGGEFLCPTHSRTPRRATR